MTDLFQTGILLLLSVTMVLQLRWAQLIHNRLVTLELEHLKRLKESTNEKH